MLSHHARPSRLMWQRPAIAGKFHKVEPSAQARSNIPSQASHTHPVNSARQTTRPPLLMISRNALQATVSAMPRPRHLNYLTRALQAARRSRAPAHQACPVSLTTAAAASATELLAPANASSSTAAASAAVDGVPALPNASRTTVLRNPAKTRGNNVHVCAGRRRKELPRRRGAAVTTSRTRELPRHHGAAVTTRRGGGLSS